ncbi:Cysteine-rich protein [Spironucleus salmonicida]|uniref:Cysteine-rich protein n=1 Tax=Spironucleus salmonicida TaxID=348837 RepID=V6LTF5_9EUKA|nr:Cysteine-rich protein [Spironucleus salmonicida]|eukprot:EST47865.1 Cysteine-rich protein [Spironucleus salmonicida]
MNKEGTCALYLTTNECEFNSYCPGLKNKDDTVCKACHENQPIGYYCNCADNIRLNCARCNGIECNKCIKGYILKGKSCEQIQSNCNVNDENCPDTYYCSARSAGKCEQCNSISVLEKCNCGGKYYSGCMACKGPFFAQCIPSLHLINGICSNTNDFGSCMSNKCKECTYCYPSSLRGISCATPNGQYAECQYNGYMFPNCAQCSTLTNQCYTCLQEFSRSSGSCLSPGFCQNSATQICNPSFYCNADKLCRSCDNISINRICQCGKNKEYQNFIKCSSSGEYEECRYGYFLHRNSVKVTCRRNFCMDGLITCRVNYYCNETNGLSQFMPASSQLIPCECFQKEHCQTCDIIKQKCTRCITSTTKNSLGECIEIDNICGVDGNSNKCYDSFTCQGLIGSTCQP